jgi:hypothetical protein
MFPDHISGGIAGILGVASMAYKKHILVYN